MKFNLLKADFMKNLCVYMLFSLMFLSSCKQTSGDAESEKVSVNNEVYEIYGEDFEADKKLSATVCS